jgi:cytochrome oxidase Cu insertion factor (SCO1/SenC/PrrC family)
MIVFKFSRWMAITLAYLALANLAFGVLGPTPAAAQVPASSSVNAKVGFEIGNLAPEIQGEDLDGVKFKLSDYRGKVVVLDFWGDW